MLNDKKNNNQNFKNCRINFNVFMITIPYLVTVIFSCVDLLKYSRNIIEKFPGICIANNLIICCICFLSADMQIYNFNTENNILDKYDYDKEKTIFLFKHINSYTLKTRAIRVGLITICLFVWFSFYTIFFDGNKNYVFFRNDFLVISIIIYLVSYLFHLYCALLIIKIENFVEKEESKFKEFSYQRVRKELWSRLMPEIKKDIKIKNTPKIKEELRLEFIPKIRKKIRLEILQDVKEEVRSEIEEEVRLEIKEDIYLEVKEEIRQEVLLDVKKEVRLEIKEDVRLEIKEDIYLEVKEEIRSEVLQDVKKEVRLEVISDIKKEVKEEYLLKYNKNNQHKNKYKFNILKKNNKGV
jgi:hypothetical protein